MVEVRGLVMTGNSKELLTAKPFYVIQITHLFVPKITETIWKSLESLWNVLVVCLSNFLTVSTPTSLHFHSPDIKWTSSIALWKLVPLAQKDTFGQYSTYQNIENKLIFKDTFRLVPLRSHSFSFRRTWINLFYPPLCFHFFVFNPYPRSYIILFINLIITRMHQRSGKFYETPTTVPFSVS